RRRPGCAGGCPLGGRRAELHSCRVDQDGLLPEGPEQPGGHRNHALAVGAGRHEDVAQKARGEVLPRVRREPGGFHHPRAVPQHYEMLAAHTRVRGHLGRTAGRRNGCAGGGDGAGAASA
ncbi:unnamed protein product, partial [Effrenium voratum]